MLFYFIYVLKGPKSKEKIKLKRQPIEDLDSMKSG